MNNQNFFLPYQKNWILDNSPLKLIEKSRQIGISWATAYSLVRDHAHANARYDAWVASRDEFQARLFLEDCKNFANTLNQATQALGHSLVDSSNSNVSTLQFFNQKRIHSLSSCPNAQAGKRGSRVLDEFALHADPHQLFKVALPGITWGGQLAIISTHRGSQNYFNQIVQDIKHNGNPQKISIHTVTLQDALDQGFLNRLKDKLHPNDPRQLLDDATYYDSIRNSCPDHESFLEEYMCVPSDYSAFFLSPQLLDDAEYATDSNWEFALTDIQKSRNDFYLGIDLARDHDFTVFWLVENVNGTFFTRKVIALKDTPFSQQEKILDELLSQKNVRRVCIDQTGIGRQFTEQAQQRYSPNRVEGITFTAQTKESMAFALRTEFENQNIRIPYDKNIRADLRAIKRQTTSAGNIRFHADRSATGHADHFWALALAMHAAKAPASITHYEAFSRSKFKS